MYSSLLVDWFLCLSISNITEKNYERIVINFF